MTDRAGRDSIIGGSRGARATAWTMAGAALIGLGYLAFSAHGGVGDPTDAAPGSLSRGTVVFESAVLVLREGLEAILVLAAVLAGLRGSNQAMRRPVSLGAWLGVATTVVTWFGAIWLLGRLGG